MMVSCRSDLLHLASIKGKDKYIHNYDKKTDELYDLAADPLEKHNLIDKMSPGEREAKRKELLDWRSRTIPAEQVATSSNNRIQKATGEKDDSLQE